MRKKKILNIFFDVFRVELVCFHKKILLIFSENLFSFTVEPHTNTLEGVCGWGLQCKNKKRQHPHTHHHNTPHVRTRTHMGTARRTVRIRTSLPPPPPLLYNLWWIRMFNVCKGWSISFWEFLHATHATKVTKALSEQHSKM